MHFGLTLLQRSEWNIYPADTQIFKQMEIELSSLFDYINCQFNVFLKTIENSILAFLFGNSLFSILFTIIYSTNGVFNNLHDL